MKFKFLLFAIPLILFSSCNKENNANILTDKTTDTTKNEDLYKVIKPLENGNDYQTENFLKIYNESLNTRLDNSNSEVTECVNFMPNDLYDKYKIGAYRIKRNSNIGYRYYYYLLVNDTLYVQDSDKKIENPSGFSEFLLTDYNEDGYQEISCISYYYGIVKSSSILSIDSKTGYHIRSYDSRNLLSFDITGNEVELKHRKIYEDDTLSENIETFSKIVPYKRNYESVENSYELESENYKVNVSFNKYLTTFPFIYSGESLYYEVTVSMTYLGESFTYRNGNTYLDGALATFTKGDYVLKMEGWSAGASETDFTINTGDVITKKYYYYDKLDNYNEDGTYDMTISYRNEKIEVKNVLKIS